MNNPRPPIVPTNHSVFGGPDTGPAGLRLSEHTHSLSLLTDRNFVGTVGLLRHGFPSAFRSRGASRDDSDPISWSQSTLLSVHRLLVRACKQRLIQVAIKIRSVARHALFFTHCSSFHDRRHFLRTQLLLFGVIHGLLTLFLWGAFAPAWAQDVCSYRAVDSSMVVDVLIDDFDRDGFNDFAARADRNVPATFQPANGRVTIFLNNTTIPATQTPAGLFGGGVADDPGVEASSTSGPFASADFDGDSFPDLVFITPDPVYNFFGNPVLRYSVLFNSSAAPGTFPTSTAGLIAPPGSLSFYGYQNHTGLDVVASDFDGDGISDFAVVHGDLGNPAADARLPGD